MSLNEDYLDDLLKAVTAGEDSSADKNLMQDNSKQSAVEQENGDTDLNALLGELMQNVDNSDASVDEMAIEEPVVDEMAIEEPVVDEMAIEEPVVDEMAIEEPVVDEMAIEEPVVDEMAIEEPVVDEMAIEEPAVDEMAIEEPVVDEMAIEEPVMDKMAIEEPVVDEMAIEEPVVDEMAIEKPVVDEMAIEEPVVDEMAIEEPVMDEMAIEEPAVDEMAIEEPVVDEMAIEEPAAQESTTGFSDIEDLLKSIEESDSAGNSNAKDESGENTTENTSENATENTTENTSENQDILAMLEGIENDSDLSEIGDLLSKDENHEAIDADIFNRNNEDDSELNILEKNEETSDEQEISEKPEKKKLFDFIKKKEKKEKPDKNVQTGEKKSLWAKFLDVFFEEVEEEKEKEIGVGEEGATDENLAILEELDNKKPAKPKKEKKKKEKKPKKEKAPKPKKPKKPKKEKIPDINEKPAKKIPRKKIIMVALFAASVFLAIYLLVSLLPEEINIKSARRAYEEGKYKEAYTSMVGMKLKGEDEEIYKKITIVLELQSKYDSYINFKKMDMGIEALNSLLKGITKYEKLYQFAEQLSVTDELNRIYQQILEALNQDYGLSEEDAKKINEYDRFTYTKKLDSIVNGTEFIDPNVKTEEESLPDMLPEEEAILKMSVVGGDEADSQAATNDTLQDELPEEEVLQDEYEREMSPKEFPEGATEE